jgi:hypothetical protein
VVALAVNVTPRRWLSQYSNDREKVKKGGGGGIHEMNTICMFTNIIANIAFLRKMGGL